MNRRRAVLRRRPLAHPLRAGVTLLELILTLAITGILLAAVCGGIATYLRVSEVGRAEVERAQLARTLLRRIADDLRSTVPLNPDQKAEKADPLLAAMNSLTGTGSGGSGGSGSGSGGNTGGVTTGGGSTGSGATGGGGSTNTSSTGGGSTTSTGGATTDTSGTSTAGGSTTQLASFVGTQYQLQFQIGRMPPIAATLMQPMPGTAMGPISADMLSDVKQVSYYLQTSAAAVGAATATFASDGLQAAPASGLVRSETSQASAEFAATQGGAAGAVADSPTPEVAALEFRYFDGAQWLAEWDSNTVGALPIAVEISLVMRAPPTGAALDPLAVASPTFVLPDDRYYRLVVHLPAASAGSTPLTATTGTSNTTSTGGTQ